MTLGVWQKKHYTDSLYRLSIILTHYTVALRRKWQPTPVFLPGESQGQKSLVGCHLWGRTESGTTEGLIKKKKYIYIVYIYIVAVTTRVRDI